MRLEDLAEQTPEFLEKLSNEELDRILSPHYKVTRPEIAAKAVKRTEESRQETLYLDPKKRAFLDMMREEGEDISYLLKKRKKI